MGKPKQVTPEKFRINKIKFHKLDWLEYITIGIGGWFLFYPQPYRLLLSILLIIPIVGIIINGWQKPSIASLVEISKDKYGSDDYDVADFIDIAAWIILVRVLLDFEFENYYSLILPGTIAFILILVLLFLTHRLIEESTKSKWWIYCSLIFNICLYSYAGTYAANCAYDYSEPRPFSSKVISKRISHGSKGRRTYYVKVAPWGAHKEKEEVSVSLEQYQELNDGDSITMELKSGLLGIPWYYIDRR